MKTGLKKMSKKPSFKGKKGLIIALILIILVAGYAVYVFRIGTKSKEEDVDISAVQELTLRDLDRNYPPTPKEVVKFYFDITKCLYNRKLSEEEVEALALKLEELFDEELADNQIKEEYFSNLKTEIKAFQTSNTIVNYSTSSSTDVDYFEENGRQCARLYGTFYIQRDKKINTLEEVFILRKDDEGHWKLYGWEKMSERQTEVTE